MGTSFSREGRFRSCFRYFCFYQKKEKLASLRVSSSFYCLRPPAAHSPFDHSQHMPPTLLFSTPNEQTGWDIHGSETKSTLGLSIERLNNKKINLEQKAQEFKKQTGFNQCQGAEEEKEKCRKERTFVFRKWILHSLFLFLFLVWDVFFLEGKHCFSDQLFPYRCRCYYCFLSRMCSCYQRQALV